MKKAAYHRYLFEAVILIISLVYIIPAWMVVINSLKIQTESVYFSIALPGRMHFENYTTIFEEANIVRALFNGFFIALSVGILAIILSSMASFAMTRVRSRLTEFLYYSFIAGIVLPGATIPTYYVLKKMSLVNTYQGIILIFLALTMPISVFLYSGFIKTVPRELDEAGIIDGCGKLRLFFSIIFPLLKPATMTVAIFNFMGVWNDIQNQIYFTSADKWTMPMMVYRFMGMYNNCWNLIFADLILTSIPVLLIYVLGQKYMVSGLTNGAVKG